MSVVIIPSNFTTALFVIVRNKVLMLQSSALKDERLIGKKGPGANPVPKSP